MYMFFLAIYWYVKVTLIYKNVLSVDNCKIVYCVYDSKMSNELSMCYCKNFFGVLNIKTTFVFIVCFCEERIV